MHIELFRAKKPIHKSLWLQGDKISINLLSGITRREIWPRGYNFCKEYLGSGDRFALNLFRLCLDARTGFSHKTPSSSPQEGWAGGRHFEVACHKEMAQQKTSALNFQYLTPNPE